MRRGRPIALVGLLLVLAAAQVAVSLRHAVQLAPPPQLFTPPQGAAPPALVEGSTAPVPPSTATVAVPASASPIATPDPANILRVTIQDGSLSPRRMQAAAGGRLQFMVTNDDGTARMLEVAGPTGTSIRSERIAKGQQVSVFIEPSSGVYQVRVVGTDLNAELRVP